MRNIIATAAAALMLAIPAAAIAQKPPPIPKGNHYVCYPAKAEFKPRKASFVDQFGEIDVEVTGITRLCAPALKRYNSTITPVVDKALHLVCYSIKVAKDVKLPKVLTNNQFGTATLVLTQPNEICLPTGKTPLG
jgi:hypothetical protein